MVATTVGPTIDEVIDTRSIHAVFQPIVDLRTMQVVGLEAFARGPEGTELESPGALFSQAAAVGRVAELDWVCRAAAFRAVLEADLPPSLSIFINAEPESLGSECPDDLRPVISRAEALLRVFIEVNDRALGADPAALITKVERARAMGWGIAVDDVGARRGTVVLLPIVHADVVKLDLGLIRDAPEFDASAVVVATLRHVESTGASLCAERIESDEGLRWARSIGAVLGQGNLLAAPGPLPEVLAAPRAPVPLVAPSDGDAPVASPFDLVDEARVRRLAREDFLALARTIAFGTISTGAAPVVLVSVGRNRFDPEFSASFPDGGPPVLYVLFGTDVPQELPPGMRAVRFDRDDPAADLEFSVHINEKGAAALIGRTLPDGDLETFLTQDRDLALDIVRHLVRRIPPPGSDGRALPPSMYADDELEAEEPAQEAELPGAGQSGGRRGVFGRRR